jgi:parallel beta-helix repeat protein
MLLGIGPATAEEVLYVSPQGNDGWSGKLPAPNAEGNDGPFASIARARDAIRELKAWQGGLREPVTVQIRGGRYGLSETITFTPEDSGTKECPISYIAFPGEKPVLCGGKKITDWQPYRGIIQYVFLPEVKAGKWYFRSLFVDGERQIRARYPNVDPADPYRKGFLYTRRGNERLGIGAMHNLGDTLEYEAQAPTAGEYAVWLRYAHNMKAFGAADMGGHTSLAVDGGEPTPLMNLPDTGGWTSYRWGRAATLRLTAGQHALRWRNDTGGSYGLDVLILSDDPAWVPTGGDWPPAAAGRHLVVVEAEFAKADLEAPHQLVFCVTDCESLPKGQKTVFPYGPSDVKPSWAEAPEAEVHIFPMAGCSAYKEITRLAKIDEQARTVTMDGPECTTDLGIGDRYFVENVLEELDSPGEWYLDRQAGILYYWPKREPLSEREVMAPVLGRLLQFEGDEAKGQTLRNVRWAGLTFTQTDYSPEDGCAQWSTGKNGVIYLQGAVNCAVENCRFVSNGKAAVLLQGGRENVISGNDISDSAEGGINVLAGTLQSLQGHERLSRSITGGIGSLLGTGTY